MNLNSAFKAVGDVTKQMGDAFMESPLVTNEQINKTAWTLMTGGGVATYFVGMAMHNEALMMAGLGTGGAGNIVGAAGMEHRERAARVPVPVKNDIK